MPKSQDDVDKVTVSYTPTNNLGGVTVVVAATGTGDTSTQTCLTATKLLWLLLGAAGTAITLTVTAEDGTTVSDQAVYTINVYRLRDLPSGNAALSALVG